MATWSTESKNTASWTDESRNLAGEFFLLLETGDFLLQEAGDKFLLESSTSWSNLNKS